MRHNIFNKLHWQLKVSLLNTCVSLSDAVAFDTTTAQVAIKKIEGVLKIFKEQLKYESASLLPLVFEYEPSIWDLYTKGHQKAANLGYGIEILLQHYNKLHTTQDKQEVMDLVKIAYQEFMQFNFNHMDDEEEVLNEILWRYYSDDVIKQVEEQLHVKAALIKHGDVGRYQAATAA